MNRIAEKFEEKGSEKLMSLFITAGFPDLESTVGLVLGFEKNGTDIIELGIPFSDPLADGPTIQHSSNIAISKGITLDIILDMVAEIRKSSEIPVILMGYMNPILRYGVSKFCEKAVSVGVDGLILPDIPLEESRLIEKEAKANNLPIIYLVAPNTSDDRMKLADQKSGGVCVLCFSYRSNRCPRWKRAFPIGRHIY